MNFVNLNSQTEEPKVVIQPINVIPQEENTSIVLKPIELNLDVPEQESEGCVQKTCNNISACTQDYFAIKNLFSELTDDYQRAVIRQNLGIADDLSLVWGKIGGNLANQKDLYKFVQEVLKNDEEGILENLNLELKYWTQQIENKIESLASNIKSLQIIPRYAIPGQLPVDVLVYWEYDQPVEAQTINGITLPVNQTEYIFTNVTDSLAIRLAYYYNGVWLARNINFEVTFPTFYGTTEDFNECPHTIKNSFTVNAGEDQYIYVFAHTPIDLSVNGIIGGFEQIGVTNISSSRYIIYKSVNPNLGETLIRIHDRE